MALTPAHPVLFRPGVVVVVVVEKHTHVMLPLSSCSPAVVPPPVCYSVCVQMAEYSINAKQTGILESVSFLDKWQDHPDVLYARPLVQVCERHEKLQAQ